MIDSKPRDASILIIDIDHHLSLGNESDALALVYDTINTAMSAGRWQFVEEALWAAHDAVGRWPLVVSLSFLTITIPANMDVCGVARAAVYGATLSKGEQQKGQEYAERMMDGLANEVIK